MKISKLQRKIYQASLAGDNSKMVGLQKRLIISQATKLKGVNKVSQENKGKHTAGVDNIKSLVSFKRMDMALTFSLYGRSFPVKRINISKTSSTDFRPLGIPRMKDRAKQALAHMALKPEWEARFEPNSFRFRPGRSCHDAL